MLKMHDWLEKKDKDFLYQFSIDFLNLEGISIKGEQFL